MSDNKGPNTEYDDEIDPEIAELIGIDDSDGMDNAPDFGDLFGGPKTDSEEPQKEDIDLSRKTFPPIGKREEQAKPFFQDKGYYKAAMGGEGEVAKRFHGVMTQFLNTQDPQERSMFRGKLIAAYWNLAEAIAVRAGVPMPLPKQLLLRFGAVLPNIISPDQRTMISKIIFKNDTGEPFYYVDEWMKKIASGEIGQSATDEIKVKKQDEDGQISSKVDRAQGQRDVQYGLLSGKLADLDAAEQQLRGTVESLTQRSENPGFSGLKQGYTEGQRANLSEIGNLARNLNAIDKEVAKLYNQLSNATESLDSLKEKATETGVVTAVDNQAMRDEFNTVRQMAKMCVGRQGNHLPVLMKQYFRSNLRDVGTRENVIIEMAAVESIDPGIFERTFKRQTNRIVPHVILVPCYGDTGICWEPFERFNRATSRGRIAIPMFPKDIKIAVITALADLRWQVAKEKAQHYWMEEGLTGHYFQWFEGKKMRGDVREYFIQDYILWITKESEGMQKLDKEVRPVFWRNIPFAQELKDNLRKRGFVYDELYKKDKNREMSDGY
ncbi:MAG: methyl-accepting chemotaxis protein [Spirochaetales bacterium]|nr:methyl-accepting chemotaxis protein [Spirochaetales bacterium]